MKIILWRIFFPISVIIGGASLGFLLGALTACPPPPLAAVPDVGFDSSLPADSGIDACAIYDLITANRLIRTPDGSALVVHCDP